MSMHKSHDTSNDETVTRHRVPTYTTGKGEKVIPSLN